MAIDLRSKLISILIGVAVAVGCIVLTRLGIHETVDSDRTRETIIAWFRHDDPYAGVVGHSRDVPIMIDSLTVARILDELPDDGDPMRVLVDVRYRAENRDGVVAPFRRTLQMVSRHGRWYVEGSQTIHLSEMDPSLLKHDLPVRVHEGTPQSR